MPTQRDAPSPPGETEPRSVFDGARTKPGVDPDDAIGGSAEAEGERCWGAGDAASSSRRGQLTAPLLGTSSRSADSHAIGSPAEDDEERGGVLPPSSIGGAASLTASLANILISVLGAGQLTLPYVMGQCGLVVGLALIVLFCAVAVYSSELLRALSAATKSATYGGAGAIAPKPF